MHQIPIPDPLYAEAQHVAASSGISLEMLVTQALELYLHDDEPQSFTLTPAQIEIVRRGQAEILAGGGKSIDQVREELEAHKQAWLQAHPH